MLNADAQEKYLIMTDWTGQSVHEFSLTHDRELTSIARYIEIAEQDTRKQIRLYITELDLIHFFTGDDDAKCTLLHVWGIPENSGFNATSRLQQAWNIRLMEI